jgi:hypothetical protein
MQSLSDVTKRGTRLTVLVLKGDNLVERGEFWTNGAGLSIAIEDEALWAQVNAAVIFLYDVPGAISAELECGWTVALVRPSKALRGAK